MVADFKWVLSREEASVFHVLYAVTFGTMSPTGLHKHMPHVLTVPLSANVENVITSFFSDDWSVLVISITSRVNELSLSTFLDFLFSFSQNTLVDANCYRLWLIWIYSMMSYKSWRTQNVIPITRHRLSQYALFCF